MYNTTTRSYTMEDASGGYDWMVEGMAPADCQRMTEKDIREWVDTLIAQAKEEAEAELDNSIEDLAFPRMGYTTTKTFENADDYRAFKLDEIESDLNSERQHVFNFLKSWIEEGKVRSVDGIAEWLKEEIFDSTDKTITGYTTFVPVDDPNEEEWGIDIVMLTECNNGNHTVAYRETNPMHDNDWRIGGLEDAANALYAVNDHWREFRDS
jgi:hypothetical protein